MIVCTAQHSRNDSSIVEKQKQNFHHAAKRSHGYRSEDTTQEQTALSKEQKKAVITEEPSEAELKNPYERPQNPLEEEKTGLKLLLVYVLDLAVCVVILERGGLGSSCRA